jgi:hypothetical protein
LGQGWQVPCSTACIGEMEQAATDVEHHELIAGARTGAGEPLRSPLDKRVAVDVD